MKPWLVLFAVPLFALTLDRARSSLSASEALRSGLGQLAETLRRARSHADTLRFLLARMLYVDGLETMFAFGGVYAAGTFGMDVAAVIMFGIACGVPLLVVESVMLF